LKKKEKVVSKHTVKKVIDFRVPCRLFPARESSVSDVPAGDGKIANLFYSAFERGNRMITTTDAKDCRERSLISVPPSFAREKGVGN
jgi:hypothetical protein